VLRNIIYISLGILVFFIGMLVYGMFLNLKEISLYRAMEKNGIAKITEPNILIDTQHYSLELYEKDTLLKKYNVVFGLNHSTKDWLGRKNSTPLGEYHICRIDTSVKYHKELMLDFPNEKDAAEALKNGIISKEDFRKIIEYSKDHNCSYDGTPLGADISIHGIGKYNLIFKNLPFAFNWTNGSIAMSNEAVDELYSVVKIGTRVTIR